MKHSERRLYAIALSICILTVLSLSVYIFLDIQSEAENGLEYSFLNPDITAISIADFEAYQSSVRVSYVTTRSHVENITRTGTGTYAVYFEDLSSGASFGLNERAEFAPKSMFKVPTAIAVLKSIEDDQLSMDSEVTLTPEMLDNEFGSLYLRGAGATITVEDLLYLSMIESDNTANIALRLTIPFERVERARLATGVPFPRANITLYTISPKAYASVFRSLYLSGYLRRPYSEYLLKLLSSTEQDNLIRAGVPEKVVVAHKIGEDFNADLYHDCGIVYHPERPYLLCIMSDAPRDEAERVIREISATVYERVSLPPAHLR